ncbi:MAG: hypothetical protein QXX68_00625 [Candidatus Pacearchaeota archaeon]
MKKKQLGIFLIFLGILLIVSNFTITGAVIGGQGVFSWLFYFGLLSLFSGAILFAISRNDLEEILGEDGSRLKEEIKELIPGKIGRPSELRKEFYQELALVVSGEYLKGRPHPYNAPKGLNLTQGTKILTRDSEILNKAMHEYGPGIYRHVYNNSTGEYLGIAKHPGGGRGDQNLVWVYKLERPIRPKK